MTEFIDIWTYLSSEPLLWLTATLAAYAAGDALFRASGRSPWSTKRRPAPSVVSLVTWTRVSEKLPA